MKYLVILFSFFTVFGARQSFAVGLDGAVPSIIPDFFDCRILLSSSNDTHPNNPLIKQRTVLDGVNEAKKLIESMLFNLNQRKAQNHFELVNMIDEEAADSAKDFRSIYYNLGQARLRVARSFIQSRLSKKDQLMSYLQESQLWRGTNPMQVKMQAVVDGAFDADLPFPSYISRLKDDLDKAALRTLVYNAVLGSLKHNEEYDFPKHWQSIFKAFLAIKKNSITQESMDLSKKLYEGRDTAGSETLKQLSMQGIYILLIEELALVKGIPTSAPERMPELQLPVVEKLQVVKGQTGWEILK